MGALAGWLARRLIASLGFPKFALELWDGFHVSECAETVGTVRLLKPSVLRRLFWQGSVGFGEAYSDGTLELDGDLVESGRAVTNLNNTRLYNEDAKLAGPSSFRNATVSHLPCQRLPKNKGRLSFEKDSVMTRTIRYTSQLRLWGWPLLAVAQGPDASRNETRGYARGIIAMGDVATGVIAIGGLARGLIAVGGVAVGLVTVAGVGLGAFVIAGVALAQTAFGGVAIGQYAKGGAAIGPHVVSSKRVDDSAAVWFSRLGLHDRKTSQPTESSATDPIE